MLDSVISRLSSSSRMVYVYGDLIVDRYLYGEVLRISPEAPVPVFSIISSKLSLGGAGLVAHNLRALGRKTFLISIEGSKHSPVDADLISLPSLLLSSDIPNCLVQDPARLLTIKTRLIDARSSYQLIRFDSEDTFQITPHIEDEVLRILSSMDLSYSVFVISDYCKGSVTERIAQYIINACAHTIIDFKFNPSTNNLRYYTNAWLITPSHRDLPVGLNIEEELRKISADYNIKNILLTMGRKGMLLLSGTKVVHLPPHNRSQIVDVTGAGDIVASTVAACVASDIDLENAVRISSVAAGISISKPGTSPVYLNDLVQELQSNAA